ncbi:MAG TPA: hypothetical protein VFV87_07270 [Pirellulaceae bacterium]|nr:hypothetical protein [Pirellulaceae bacterium]
MPVFRALSASAWVLISVGLFASSVFAGDASAPAVLQTVLLGSSDLTAGIPGKGPLTADQIKAWLANPKSH